MKKTKITTGILTVALVTLSAVSCKDTKKENNDMEGDHMEQMEDSDHMDGTMEDHSQMDMAMSGDAKAEVILKDYFSLKNALVSDDNSMAKELGNTLAQSLKSFDASGYSDSEQNELNDIVEDATEHAEHISESDIAHQREHFKVLSKDMTDMVAITGTSMKIYEQFCPMYDNNKGGAWLSMNEEIKNPYFGAKMLKCGKVQREIN